MLCHYNIFTCTFLYLESVDLHSLPRLLLIPTDSLLLPNCSLLYNTFMSLCVNQ